MTLGRQKGTTTVEFAIVGFVAMLVLLGVFESCRLVFVVNALEEVTRRGARMAAVCPVNDPAIARTAIFSQGGTQSPIISGLSTENIRLEYLNGAGNAITGDLTEPTVFTQIEYVRVSVQNFAHQMILPVPLAPVTLPGHPTTLPRESLGVPRGETIQPC